MLMNIRLEIRHKTLCVLFGFVVITNLAVTLFYYHRIRSPSLKPERDRGDPSSYFTIFKSHGVKHSYRHMSPLSGWLLTAAGHLKGIQTERNSGKNMITTGLIQNLNSEVFQVLDEAYHHIFDDFRAYCMSPALLRLSPSPSYNNNIRILLVNRLVILDRNGKDGTLIPSHLCVTELDENTRESPHNKTFHALRKPRTQHIPIATGFRAGPEDPRLYYDPVSDDIAILFYVLDVRQTRRSYVWWMNASKLVKLVHPEENSLPPVTKNWSFIKQRLETDTSQRNRETKLVFSLIPLIILKCPENGLCEYESNTAWAKEKSRDVPVNFILSGGTPYEHYRDDYYYSFIHSNNNECLNRRRYTMHLGLIYMPKDMPARFVYFSDSLQFHPVLMQSDPNSTFPEMKDISGSFIYPVSILKPSLNSQTESNSPLTDDVLYVGAHRNNEQCLVIMVKGILQLLNSVIQEDQRFNKPDNATTSLKNKTETTLKAVKNVCPAWTS